MKKLILLTLLLAMLLSSLLAVSVSGQAGIVSSGDPCFTGAVWPATSTTPAMQWAQRFACTLPLAQGIYDISFTMQEPPNAVPVVSGPGQRVFTVSMQGQTSQPIDLFKLNGMGAYSLHTKVVQIFDGTLPITFVASVRNAVVSQIQVTPMTPGGLITSSLQIQALPCPPSYTGPILPDGNCLYFVSSGTAPYALLAQQGITVTSSGVLVGTRPIIDFVAGSNVNLALTDTGSRIVVDVMSPTLTAITPNQ